MRLQRRGRRVTKKDEIQRLILTGKTGYLSQTGFVL